MRTDLWALGAILYEMVTGKRAFEGTSAVSLMSAIMDREPPSIASLQPLTPPALERLVRRCLAKSADDRPDTAHDVADDLRWTREAGGIHAVTSVQRGRGRGVRTAFIVAAGPALIAMGAALMWFLRPAAPSPLPVHATLEVNPAEEVNAGAFYSPMAHGGALRALAWTPDGRAIVFAGRRAGVQQLYVRQLDAAEARPLPHTDDAYFPAVSPDGQWVAFWAAESRIVKMPLNGGLPSRLASCLPRRGLRGMQMAICWSPRV